MTEQTSQEGQKTVTAFVAGLLVGGLLVWIFSDTSSTAPNTPENEVTEVTLTEEESVAENDAPEATTEAETEASTAPELPTGDSAAVVASTEAGLVVPLASATFPTDEGWIGVRSYVDGEVTNILGAARYSKEQGLIPESIPLLTPTIAGRQYAIVFFTEDGDRQFNPRLDLQVGEPATIFTAE